MVSLLLKNVYDISIAMIKENSTQFIKVCFSFKPIFYSDNLFAQLFLFLYNVLCSVYYNIVHNLYYRGKALKLHLFRYKIILHI